MLTNSKLTVYHYDGVDEITHNNIWTRYNYDKVWFFGGKGAGLSKGYDNANDVQIRIPYDENTDLDVSKFSIGDILVQGELDEDIQTQQDLEDYLIYNITSITDNTYGRNQHINIGGK